MRKTLATTAALAATSLLLALAPRTARGQDGTTTTTTSATAATTPAAPAPPPPPPPPERAEKEDEGVTDHGRFVGRLGVTYFDITNLPVANPLVGGGGLTSTNVTAPVIGVRYWLMPRIGIDGGIGLGFAGGSDETVANNVDTTVQKVASNGFAFHVGVPVVLADAKHFTFLVIPQATLGFTSATYSPPGGGGPNQSLSGFLADVGVRVGPEIHFGFIGLPQLALQATVGLSYRRSVYKESGGGSSSSDGTSTFGTQVNGDPWAIFTDGISATYYF